MLTGDDARPVSVSTPSGRARDNEPGALAIVRQVQWRRPWHHNRMTSVVWAAFDFPTEPGRREGERLRGRFLRPPVRTLAAATLDEVPRVVDEADHAARAGSWVVGGLRYEAAGAWDRAQRTRLAEEHGLESARPLAHFEVYDGEPEPWPDAEASVPQLDWRDLGTFVGGTSAEQSIEVVRDHIARGDCYQVNLTTRLWASASVDLDVLFERLSATQPGGYALFLRGAGVASVSPELFFQAALDGRLTTQPMKGTAARPPGEDANGPSARALLASDKDRAENLMIVDLLRNDLGRVCDPGSVRVEALYELVELPTVWQLTSTVTGRTSAGTRLVDIFAALFPCGSITGAPKIRAMEVIAELESAPRGWYCGALGVIRPGGDAIFNVPIRTVEAADGGYRCGIGSGIVFDSDPASEVAEWAAKARFLHGRELAALETLLLESGRIARLDRHLVRVQTTCHALGLPTRDEAGTQLLDVAASHPLGRHRLRLVITHDGSSVELHPMPETPAVVRLALASHPLETRGHLRPLIVHKTTLRSHYEAARRDRAPGVFDVICWTPRGELTECTTGNVALRIDGEWLTPAAGVGLLPGVLRGELLESGALREAELSIADLARADALAFVNSLRGWCPAELDQRPDFDPVP